jgi:hypothetical protein
VVVVALVVVAFVLPRRSARSPRRAPRAWLVGFAALVLLAADALLNDTWGWLGAAIGVLTLTLLGVLLVFWSRCVGWDRMHLLAAGGAALVVYAVLAFAVDQLGASPTARYVSSVVALTAVLGLLAWARHRLRADAERSGSR